MSDQNSILTELESIRVAGDRAYADFRAWAAGGSYAPFLEHLKDDATLVFFPAPPPFNAVQSGRAQIADFFHRWDAQGLKVQHDHREPMVSSRSYAVELRAHGTLNGAPREINLLVVFDFDADRISAVREYGQPPRT